MTTGRSLKAWPRAEWASMLSLKRVASSQTVSNEVATWRRGRWRTPVTGDAEETLLEVENYEHLGIPGQSSRGFSGNGRHTELFLSSLSQANTFVVSTGVGV